MTPKTEAMKLREVYRKCITEWTWNINELRITRVTAKYMAVHLRLTGYTNPVQQQHEEKLVALLGSSSSDFYQLSILVSDSKVLIRFRDNCLQLAG